VGKHALKRYIKQARRRVSEMVGYDRYSRPGRYDIETRLAALFPQPGGVFIEAGANDGFTQSNTYWLERFRGWRGILVEPDPAVAAQCRRARPNAFVVNAALVPDPAITTITISTANLMGYVTGHFSDHEHEKRHRRKAMEYQQLAEIRDIAVPARTLESVIAESGFSRIDFFSLDVEGYEAQVLRGMNVARYRPRYLLVEGLDPTPLLAALDGHYTFVEHATPQDVLLRALD